MNCHSEPCPFMTHGPRSTLPPKTEFLETDSMITGPRKTREAASDGVCTRGYDAWEAAERNTSFSLRRPRRL